MTTGTWSGWAPTCEGDLVNEKENLNMVYKLNHKQFYLQCIGTDIVLVSYYIKTQGAAILYFDIIIVNTCYRYTP